MLKEKQSNLRSAWHGNSSTKPSLKTKKRKRKISLTLYRHPCWMTLKKASLTVTTQTIINVSANLTLVKLTVTKKRNILTIENKKDSERRTIPKYHSQPTT